MLRADLEDGVVRSCLSQHQEMRLCGLDASFRQFGGGVAGLLELPEALDKEIKKAESGLNSLQYNMEAQSSCMENSGDLGLRELGWK